MTDSNTPIVLVVCNDYGELALAMYLLTRQSFAQNTTLMLPPGLHAKNPDILPGHTLVYHSIDDIQKELESQNPGVLGLFSGYLLPVHRLCNDDELGSLLRSARAQGWELFTSDPFLGLLEDLEPGELVTFKLPKWSALWSLLAVTKKMRLAAKQHVDESIRLLTEMRHMLQGVLHVYPVGKPPTKGDQGFGQRLHFHNPGFISQTGQDPSSPSPMEDPGSQRWLFVLGDQDYAVQEEKYGQTIWTQGGISRKFREVLLAKLHETLETGRMPTLVAPAKVIEAVRKHSPAADSMELLAHCDYSHFQSLLTDAEYVFYWNAVSFTCIPRTLMGKPWFTFDDGHLLRGMNVDYASRISEWFYQGVEPPRMDIDTTLTCDALQKATEQYLESAHRVRYGLLASNEPPALLTSLDALAVRREAEEEQKALLAAFEILQELGGIVAANELDGNFVVDTDLLAHSKNDIRAAATLLIEHGNEEQATFASSAVLTSAFFQSGVGEGRQPIDSLDPDGKPWRAAVQADMFVLTKGSPNQEAQSPVSEAHDILRQLVEIVSENELGAGFVVDTDLLAHPKSDINSAVMLLIEAGSKDQAAFASSAALTLAFFQPRVGAGRQAIDSPDPDGNPWRATVEAEMHAISEGLPT